MTPQQRLRSECWRSFEIVRNEKRRVRLLPGWAWYGRYRGWGICELPKWSILPEGMLRRSSNGWGDTEQKMINCFHLADIIDELGQEGKRRHISITVLLASYYPTAVAKTQRHRMQVFKGEYMLDPLWVVFLVRCQRLCSRAQWYGIELDWLTGQIAKKQHQIPNVLVTSYGSWHERALMLWCGNGNTPIRRP